MPRFVRRRAPARRRTSIVLALSLIGAALVLPIRSAAASATPACGTDGTPSVVALQDPHFYVDTSVTPELLAGYAGYAVNAGSSARSHLWLALGGFTGGIVDLASGQPAAQPLPLLASGASSTQYFLLAASGTTSTPQSHTVTVYDGRPGTGTPLCTRTFAYADVVDTIKALANKVTSITASGTASDATIGSTVTITVQGNTGTLGAGPGNDPGVLSYTPDVLANFPAAAWRLERTDLSISPDGSLPPRTYVDQLRLAGASGAARDYTARYTFRAIGPTTVSAAVKPVQYIASGTQVKHTDTPGTALYALPAVSPIADLSLSRQVVTPADGTVANGGGAVTHLVTASNAGSGTGELDWLDETMPAGASYVPGSLTVNGRPAPDPTVDGRDLVVDGPLLIPAASSATLRFEEAVDGTPGARTSSAVAYFGTSQIDGSRDVRASDPATATVRVLGSQGPTAAADSATTAAGTTVTIPVLANDSSPSGLPLAVTAVSTPSAGTASVDPDGEISYSPNNNVSGSDTFTYTVGDGYLSATGTVTVTVTPTASSDIYATGKGTTLTATASVLANDACSNCTASLASGPTMSGGNGNGTLTLHADGTFTYVPPANTTGTATFTYRASGSTGSATATVTINVSDVAPDYATTAINTSTDINVKANDPGCSNSGCKPQAGSAPTRGTADYAVVTPNVRYTPTTGKWGLDSFSYGVTGSSGSATAPVTVLVGPPALTLTTTYGTQVSSGVPASGSCNGCTFSLRTPPSHGAATVNSATGAITYTPAPSYAGSDTFDYRVQDPTTGLRVPGSVTIIVTPAAGDDAYRVVSGHALTADVTGNDACSATCTWALNPGAPAGMTMSAAGQLSWTPASTTMGSATASYTVTSSAAPASPATGQITVWISGAEDDQATTATGSPVTIPVQANDPCATCAVTAASDGTVGSTHLNADSTVTYTPRTGFSGTDHFSYTITNGSVDDTAHVTVTVTPTAVGDNATTLEGQAAQLLPLDNDQCVNCSIIALGTAAHGSVELDGDVVTYTPDDGYTGSDSFTYTLADSSGATSDGTVAIIVVAPPVVVDDSASGASGTTFIADVLGNDECEGCTVSLASDPTHGSAAVDVTGDVRYLPNPGYTGPDLLVYTATDAQTGAHAQATLTLDVEPVATDDSVRTAVDQPVIADVTANDICAGACTVDIDAAPAHGDASTDGTSISYQPTDGFSGADRIGYSLTDPTSGDTAQATVTVDVNDAAPDAATTQAGEPVTVDVLSNDLCTECSVTNVDSSQATWSGSSVTYTPPDGFWGLDVLTYTAGSGETTVTSTLRILVAPPVRTLNVEPSTSGSLAAVGDDCASCEVSLLSAPQYGDIDLSDSTATYGAGPEGGLDSFRYRITDPVAGIHVAAEVDVTVADASPPPASEPAPVDDTAFTTSHGGSISIDVLGNDPAGATLGTISTPPSHGTADVADATITYAPTSGYVGSDTFSYTLAGSDTTADVTVTVQPSEQTITFPTSEPADLATTGAVTLGATAPGGTVAYESLTPQVCSVSEDTATLLDVGTCTLRASQPGGDGWNPAPDVQQSFIVGRTLSPQQISFDPPQSLTLDHTGTQLLATADSGLPVSLASLTPAVCTIGDDGTSLVLVASGTCRLDATQAGDAYYSAAAPVSAAIDVSKLGQTIDFADVADTAVADASIAIAPTASSGLTVEVDTETPSVCLVDAASNTVSLATPGTCRLTATQSGNWYWSPAPSVSRTFQVTRNSQSIHFAALDDVAFGSGSVVPTATADSGLAVQLASTSTDVCDVTGSQVELRDVGTCTLTADQPGNEFWSAAPTVSRSFHVTPADQTISALVPPSLAADADPQPLQGAATSGLPVSWSSLTPDTCAVANAAVVPLAAGECTLKASQPGNNRWSAAVPVTVHLTITAPVSRAVDDTFEVPAAMAGTTVKLDVLANDGAGLHLTSVTQPAHGSTAPSGDVIEFAAPVGFAGTTTFTYTVSNARGQQFTASVRVTVPDTAPTLRVGTARTVSGRSVLVPLTSADRNGDLLRTTVHRITGARTRLTDSGVVVTPGTQVTGRLRIVATVTDPAGESATAAGWVMVSPRPATDAEHSLDGTGTIVHWAPSRTRSVRYAVSVNGVVRCVTSALKCRLGEPYGARAHLTVTAIGHDGSHSGPTPAATRAGEPVLIAVVHFATASSALRPAAAARLRWVASKVGPLGLTTLHAIGYTDGRGGSSYNLHLSHRRVLKVVGRLHALRSGLHAIIGWEGVRRPVKSNQTPTGRAANRRVEIWVS